MKKRSKRNNFLNIWIICIVLLFGLYIVGGISPRDTYSSTDTSGVIGYTEHSCGTGGSYIDGKCSNGATPKVRYKLEIKLVESPDSDSMYECWTEYDKTSCNIELPTESWESKVIYGWTENEDSCDNLITGSYTITTQTKVVTLYPCYNLSHNTVGVCPDGFFELEEGNIYACRSVKGASDGFGEKECTELGGDWYNTDNPEKYNPWCYTGYSGYKITVKLDDGCGSVEEVSCTTENGNASCNLDLPTKVGSNSVIGWTETKDTCSSVKTGKYSVNVTTSVDALYACYSDSSSNNCSNTGTPSGTESSNTSSSNNSTNNNTGVDSDGNVTSNPQTGEIVIFIVWLLGIVVIGYAVYYFKEMRKN